MKKPIFVKGLALFALGLSVFPGLSFAAGKISSNEFNPAISLILDGRYSDLDQADLSLAGFQLGGEAELPEQGFSLGHNELGISANKKRVSFSQASAT